MCATINTGEKLNNLNLTPTFTITETLNILQWDANCELLFGYALNEIQSVSDAFETYLPNIARLINRAFQTNQATIRMDQVSVCTKNDDIISLSLLAFKTTYLNEKVLQVYCLPDQDTATIGEESSHLIELKNGIISSYMTVVLDHEGFITSTNTAFLKVSQWTPKRVIGKTFWNLFPANEENEKITQVIWKTISSGSVWQGEVEKITKNGDTYWVFLTAIPITNGNKFNFYLIEHDITKDKLLQIHLEKIAYIDNETGLNNVHRLEQVVNDMIDENKHFSFVYLSLDNYYTLKELHQNSVGETLIVDFTKRLKMYFQDSLMARVNENDFVILTPLPEWFTQGFLSYLQQNPIYNNSVALPVSLSGGITRYPEDQKTFPELMKASLATIQQVREAGGGSIVSLSKSIHKALNRKSIVEKRLLLALDQENLKVLYQPQVDLKTGEITAVEAFVRWHDEEIGVVSPDELIPIAEETGLINNIGKFMLEKACEQAVKWKQMGINLKISINSSVREFRDKNMAKSILETLDRTGCPANLIQLEITEKFALEAEAETSIIKQMKQLESEGIVFILDDFGTGYASFRYIQLLPLQILKIDQMFTNSLLQSERQQRLVHGMIQLGKSMNLTVLAEGVETEEQSTLLDTLGCDAIQGYYISKPVEADEIAHIIYNAN
jgi:PAS domain S-box-containing protein